MGTTRRAMTVVEAPGKLTLSLAVAGARSDGYHVLDAEMVTIDLVDTLEFGDGDGLTVIGDDGLDPGPTNLVSRALNAIGRHASVRLTKRIPRGAGLGGGSADAAAVLRWAGCADLAVAAQLGADVPFCVVGGRAHVTGIGEIIEPLPFEARMFTLLIPPFGVNTAAVYRAWDALGGPSDPSANDLTPAALVVEPRLAEWRDRLGDATGQQPKLAGSGSTWWVPGAFEVDDGIIVRTVRY